VVAVVNGDDDTLTESCEGATGIMVERVNDGSLRELPVNEVVECRRSVKTEASVPQIGIFFFQHRVA
jgi:hypothetical protein